MCNLEQRFPKVLLLTNLPDYVSRESVALWVRKRHQKPLRLILQLSLFLPNYSLVSDLSGTGGVDGGSRGVQFLL